MAWRNHAHFRFCVHKPRCACGEQVQGLGAGKTIVLGKDFGTGHRFSGYHPMDADPRVERSGSVSIGGHGQGDATVDELTQPWRLQSHVAAVGFNKAISVQCHFSVQSNSAAKLFDPSDVFRTNSLSVLETPPQPIKWGLLV